MKRFRIFDINQELVFETDENKNLISFVKGIHDKNNGEWRISNLAISISYIRDFCKDW